MSKHRVRSSSTRELQYDKDVDNPYQQWVEQHNGFEPIEANPDQLEDCPENNVFANRGDTSLATMLIKRFLDEQGNFPTLSAKENQTLRLYTTGKSMEEVAKSLGIKKATVQYYLDRASKKLKKLLNSVKGVEF